MKQLWIDIEGEHGMEHFKFHKKYPLYAELRDELLSRFPNNPEVTVTNGEGRVYDELKLMDLFNTK